MQFFSPRLSQSPDSSSDFGNKLRSRCHKVLENYRGKVDQLIVNESQHLSGVFLRNNLYKMTLDVQYFRLEKIIFNILLFGFYSFHRSGRSFAKLCLYRVETKQIRSPLFRRQKSVKKFPRTLYYTHTSTYQCNMRFTSIDSNMVQVTRAMRISRAYRLYVYILYVHIHLSVDHVYIQ